jgi:hypothetical protein
MIRLHEIILSSGGRRVDFDYSTEGPAGRFIDPRRPFYVVYDRDVSACPPSVLAVPFAVNFEPLGWFGNFQVSVPDIDRDFAESRAAAKAAFAKMYPGKIGRGGLVWDCLVPNQVEGDDALLLFSGGLDAYATLLRLGDRKIRLVTYLGADIAPSDRKQWAICTRHLDGDPALARFPRHVIEANLREFYTDEVDARLLYGWWGGVQHGHALLGTMAPLAYVMGARTCFISGGSTTTVWGSTKASDETLSWAGVRCRYDADGMARQEKAALVSQSSRFGGATPWVRVCYSEVERDGNCGRCEKCYRTMMNFVLTGADPRAHGLPMDEHSYGQLFRRMTRFKATMGIRLCWQEISSSAREALTNGRFFVLRDRDAEESFLRRIAGGEIDRALARNHRRFARQIDWAKFVLRVRWPRVYGLARRLARILF